MPPRKRRRLSGQFREQTRVSHATRTAKGNGYGFSTVGWLGGGMERLGEGIVYDGLKGGELCALLEPGDGFEHGFGVGVVCRPIFVQP